MTIGGVLATLLLLLIPPAAHAAEAAPHKPVAAHHAPSRHVAVHRPVPHHVVIRKAAAHPPVRHPIRHAPYHPPPHRVVRHTASLHRVSLLRPRHPAPWLGERGEATYYAASHRGQRMATGLRYDPDALTAAHPWLPFGTRVRVRLVGTQRSVVVVITDRSGSTRSVIDLSYAAARSLGILGRGTAEVALSPG